MGVAPGDMGEVLQGLARADLRAAPTLLAAGQHLGMRGGAAGAMEKTCFAG